jgi:hypothetical protein
MGDSYAVDGLLHEGISAHEGRGTQTRSSASALRFGAVPQLPTLT